MKIRHIISATLGTLLLPAAAFAQRFKPDDSFGDIGKDVYGQTGAPDLAAVVGKIIAQFMGLLGVVMVCLFIYAGFLYMTAGGNEDKVKFAKKIISNAVIGSVLIFLSYAIARFVVNAATGATQN